MLKPIFDPLHRTAGDACSGGDQYNVRKHSLLDAEAAAGVRRRAQAQPVAGHLERARYHRVNAERPLKIGQDVESVFAWVVIRDDAVGFDRRAGIAGIADIDRDTPRCAGKGGFGISITEMSVARDVGWESIVKQRRRWLNGFQRINHSRADRVAHVNQIDSVLRLITVRRNNDRDRFTYITNAVHRNRPALDRGFD